MNWVIAVASLVAAILLLWKPRNGRLVALAGIVWPIAYALALAVDVYTKLCLGGDSAYCWPSRTAAFDYLILNNPSISGSPGYGWQLAPVVPVAIVLLAIVFLISLVAVISTRKGSSAPDQEAVPAEVKPSTAPQQ